MCFFLLFSINYLFGQANNEVENITEDEGLVSNYIFGIVRDQDNFMWAASDKGLAKYHDKKWHVLDADSGMPGNYVNQMASDHKQGLLLYFSEKGLFYFDTRLNKIIRKYNYPIKNSVKLCNSDINPNYLIVIGENGKIQTINRYDIKNLKTLSYSKNSNGSLTFFLMENGKKINVATDKIFKNKVYGIGKNTYEPIYGLGILVKENGKVRDTITENEGLGSNLLSGVYQTPSKDLIFTTLGGGASVIRNFNSRKTFKLENSSVRSLQYENGIYYILADGYLKILDDRKFIKKIKLSNDALSFLVKGDILYVGTFSNISKYSIKNFELKLLESTVFTFGVSKIFENQGKIYFTTYGGGIQQYPRGQIANDYPFLTIENFFRMKDGFAAISYENGLFTTDKNLNIKTFHNKNNGLKSNYVANVFSDDDTIWVGSKNQVSGLLNGKVVTNYNSSNGFTGNMVKNIFRGKNGFIWVVSDRMIMKKIGKKLIPLGSLNFLGAERDITLSSIYVKELNKIAIVSKSQFSTIDLDKIHPKQNPEMPKILSISSDGNEITDWEKIVLPHENKYINFYFDSVDKQLLTSSALYYKVNNGDWEKFEDPQVLQFQHLDQGKYKINFKTINSDGYEKLLAETITVKVDDIFYKKWWFFLLSLLLTFGVAALFFYEMSQNKIKKKFEEIRIQSELEAERKRISRDLHDNIGAYTTSLIAKVDNIRPDDQKDVNQLFEIREDAEYIMSLLRQTIWVLGTKESPVSTYIDSFRNYIHKYLIPYPHISYELIEEIDDPNKMFESTKLLSLFRIVQEALQNAVKHSGADKITVKFNSKNKIKLEIRDNGKGFDVSEKHFGYGLKNMKVRAEELNFDLHINTDITGTSIQLQEK
ncbi:ATP-binding protein [uncultured Chryseobacterium sp.]|uniref:sensor histidine kinase n=1 Tax=uncultured Chryseobacterium sp. TaxID=259322 RepID=UPI0026037173|nr:ATP-binding protein [uncultured Chryseobacterium sp.]